MTTKRTKKQYTTNVVDTVDTVDTPTNEVREHIKGTFKEAIRLKLMQDAALTEDAAREAVYDEVLWEFHTMRSQVEDVIGVITYVEFIKLLEE